MLPDEKKHNHIQCTMFNKMCYINPHYDGLNNNKLCNILIYLNDDYKNGYGGELIIKNESLRNNKLIFLFNFFFIRIIVNICKFSAKVKLLPAQPDRIIQIEIL